MSDTQISSLAFITLLSFLNDKKIVELYNTNACVIWPTSLSQNWTGIVCNSDIGRTSGYSGEPDGDFIQSLLRRNLNKLA